ncbi:MAG: hypothetical protein HYV27_15855 [Candidatus Hydrogenedentes bacterium]|nr:hypothetical protein [Candidatus Hydrogenedentota bacterium]
MIEHLIAYVDRTGPEDWSRLTLQDIALCRLWADEHMGTPAETNRVTRLREAIAAWQSQAATPETATAGRRHQWILRGLLDELRDGRLTGMHTEDTAFLCAVHDFLLPGIILLSPSRVVALLEPHLSALRARQGSGRVRVDFKHLRSRQSYVTAVELMAAPVKETRLLAGIDLPGRGPVFSAKNNVRVLGDVPDNCTVVVEGLHCCAVDGYVLGRVLSKLHCEVRGNVAGIIVVLQGDIRARSIVNNAQAISKLGSVYCWSAQGPKLVFAGKSIDVADGALMGAYITRVLNVANDLRGGSVHIADNGTAAHFRHFGMSNLEIVLRRDLSCEDYGEVTGVDLRRLLSEAYRLRRIARNYALLEEAATNEVEHAAQGVLMYLFGGGESHKKLEDYLQTERRLEIVTRIVDNMALVLERAQDDLTQRGARKEAALPDPDFGEFLQEGPVDPDLQQENEEVNALRSRLNSAALDHRQTRLLLDQAREKILRLMAERDALQQTLQQKGKGIQTLEKYEKVLTAGASSAENKIQVLQRILPAIRKQPDDSPLAIRLRTGFATMTLGAIERKQKHIAEYAQRRTESLENFRAVSERLGKDFQVRVLAQQDESGAARVTGIFEKGVRIIMDDPPEDGAPPPEGSIVTTSGEPAVRTYIRANTGAKFYARRL